MGSRIITRADFTEGVRAVLIDKDNNAKWVPATPEEVQEEELESMLKPFSEGTTKATLGVPDLAAVDPPPEGALEVKVTVNKSSNFYARVVAGFLQGLEAKPAEDGKEAVEAKAPVEAMRISGTGAAINVAITAALEAVTKGLCTITRIQSASPTKERWLLRTLSTDPHRC